MDFNNKPNIFYKPLDVEIQNVLNIATSDAQNVNFEENDIIADKLMGHLALIEDYNNKIKAIDWLIDNAKKMSGNLKYSTNDPYLVGAIKDLSGEGTFVDFKLFEKAVDIVIEGYKQQALISLTGAAN